MSENDAKRERSLFLGIKYELGRSYSEKGLGDRARRYLKGAIKLDRSFLPAYIGLGGTLLDEGKPQNAAELLEKAFGITRNIILLHRLEELYLELDEPEQIIRIYQEAIQRDPGNKVLRFYLGKLYYRLEMVEDAFDTLAELESSEERFPDLHKILGNLYLRRGQLGLAVDEFKKALNLKKLVVVPYYCPLCDYHTTEWSGRCQRCGQWNTFLATPILGERKRVQLQAKGH
jgi:tetratricopeptide (TPR) repeat protein